MRLKGGLLVVGIVACLGAGISSASSPTLGPGTVVSVAGAALSQQTVDHWLTSAAFSEAAPRAAVIVPTDPPRFSACVKAVRSADRTLAKKPTRTLRRACRRLFKSLSHEVLDFLIRAHWYEDLARADHIRISRAEVVRAFRRAKRQQFRTRRNFDRFLRETHQTVEDILFRFRVNIAYTKLLKRTHEKSPVTAQQKLDSQARRRYRPTTVCARYYVMADCANFSPSRHG
jgi:hypothetical protein